MAEIKVRAMEQAKALREAAQLHDPMARGAVELLRLTVEDLKDRLVDADGNDMLRLQGAIRQFSRLHRELTVTPPAIKTNTAQER